MKRGFTMVELLAVIAMIGVLAAISTLGYRKYVNTAATADAKAVISAIRVAQESYRAETMRYLDCGANWYPYDPAGLVVGAEAKYHWSQPTHPNSDCWRQLNVANDSPTRFGFITRGRGAGEAPFALVNVYDNAPTLPAAPAEPFYIVEARGDADNDNNVSRFIASSFTGEIYVENESE